MFDENIKFKYSWRPYQEKVLKDVDKYIGDKRINIVAAPGSGKTVLGLELARKLSNPVLILSPTVTIKNQWIDRFITLFMPEGSNMPEWISDNVYNLSYFNSITYQGLHYAYKRKKERMGIDKEETDDEIIEEKIETDIDIKTYDLIAEIKKNNISTIILDEAHHLKSEWWQSLIKVIESLENITIVSLTATPPYDVEYNEWKKYIELCGNIDMEISVPELVQAKNLCPHQDYIYFSYPTQEEEKLIEEYENKVINLMDSLKNNLEFIDMLKKHPYINDSENNIEDILENTEFYSSMLIFLNFANVEIDKKNINRLGYNKSIPNITANWLEILLQNIIFGDDIYFENYIEIIEELQVNLNKIGAIEKKRIFLTKNSNLQKYFINSISKLESINKIVETEINNLKQDLRMVILTDFLRKEYLFEDNVEINKIGVFPIFLNLINQNPNIKIAILTGSIFMIPVDKKEKLIENIVNMGIDYNDIEFISVLKVTDYIIVKSKIQNKNKLMKSISKLFSDGEVNIIIGTKSLLGEGWDEPSINSLILASFVGSYVLSNQMRGRAIRINTNPYKTANVWHLVCVMNLEGNRAIENEDFEMIKRRFKSFVGIGYNKEVLEDGVERLDIIPNKFTNDNIDKYNQELIKLSNDRTNMYNRWFKLIDKFGGNKIKIASQLETKKKNLKEKELVHQHIRILKFILMYLLILIIYIILKSSETNTPIDLKNFNLGELKICEYILVFIILLLLNLRNVINGIRVIKLLIPKNKLKIISKIVVKTLCDIKMIKTRYRDIKIKVKENKNNDNIGISIDGVTTHENNLIINSIREVFSNEESQRYIIISKNKKNSDYCNVPSILASNKEFAIKFYKNWKRYLEDAKLIYTKSLEGKKVLFKIKKDNFNFYNPDKFIEKKKTI